MSLSLLTLFSVSSPAPLHVLLRYQLFLVCLLASQGALEDAPASAYHSFFQTLPQWDFLSFFLEPGAE